jgi:hypothetical protein
MPESILVPDSLNHQRFRTAKKVGKGKPASWNTRQVKSLNFSGSSPGKMGHLVILGKAGGGMEYNLARMEKISEKVLSRYCTHETTIMVI